MSNKFIAIDIETSGLDWTKDEILGIGDSEGTFTTNFLSTTFAKAVSQIPTVVYHNGSFDTKFLWANGLPGINEFDTMVAAYLLTDAPNKLSLDSLVSYYLGLPSHKDDIKSGAVFEDPELLKLYCLKDAELTAQLAPILEQKLIDEGKLDFFYKLMEARRMLTRAEYRGVLFDREVCTVKQLELQKELDRLNVELLELHSAPKFNFNSPKQVLKLLKDLGCNVMHPLTKKESADIVVLEANASRHPIVRKIVDMRQTKKLLSTLEGYQESVRSDGALHPNFNCTNTRTGRLSSSGDLNIQQVDRDPSIRALFKARPGYKLVMGDLAQIEPRLAAHYSKDPVLMDMFKNGEDLYGTIAVQLLGADCAPNDVKKLYPNKRALAKVIGLSVLYGIGANKLRNMIAQDAASGLPNFTASEAYSIIDNYFKKFAGLKDLQKGVHKVCTTQGYITNYFGRKVDVSEDEIFMTGVNTLIQSSASDYMMFKTVEFMKNWADKDVHLLMLVHDEAVYEVPDHLAADLAADLEAHMCKADFRVPLLFDVKVGPNWSVK